MQILPSLVEEDHPRMGWATIPALLLVTQGSKWEIMGWTGPIQVLDTQADTPQRNGKRKHLRLGQYKSGKPAGLEWASTYVDLGLHFASSAASLAKKVVCGCVPRSVVRGSVRVA